MHHHPVGLQVAGNAHMLIRGVGHEAGRFSRTPALHKVVAGRFGNLVGKELELEIRRRAHSEILKPGPQSLRVDGVRARQPSRYGQRWKTSTTPVAIGQSRRPELKHLRAGPQPSAPESGPEAEKVRRPGERSTNRSSTWDSNGVRPRKRAVLRRWRALS